MRPEIVSADAAQIIMYGAFFRTFLDTSYSIDFTPYMTSPSLEKIIEIDQAGVIQSASGADENSLLFNRAPGIRAALFQMGIPLKNNEITDKVLGRILNGQEKLASVCAQQIIQYYAEEWAGPEALEPAVLALVEKGIFGFLGLETSPPQRALISAMASISQYTHDCEPKRLIIKCVELVFLNHFQPKASLWEYGISFLPWTHKCNIVDPTSEEYKIAGAIFTKSLSESIQLQYEEVDAPAGKGLFTLHQRNLQALYVEADLGKKISDARQFQLFIKQVIENAEKACEAKSGISSSVKTKCLAIFTQMSTYAATQEFVREAVAAFDPKKPENLPWSMHFGGSDHATRWAYMNTDPAPQLLRRIQNPVNVGALLDWFLGEIFRVSYFDRSQLPRYCDGGCNAPGIGHAFNWMLDHTSVLRVLKTAKEQNITVQEALNQCIKDPGIEVSDSPIQDKGQLLASLENVILQAAKERVEAFADTRDFPANSPIEPLSTYQKRLLKTAAEKLLDRGEQKLDSYLLDLLNEWKEGNHGELTIYGFSQHVLAVLEKKFNKKHSKILSDAFTCLISDAILKALSSDQYQKIAENALHVADSNWQKNDYWPKDIQFSVFLNPATKDYSLGLLTEDNQGLQALPIIEIFDANLQDLRQLPVPNISPLFA